MRRRQTGRLYKYGRRTLGISRGGVAHSSSNSPYGMPSSLTTTSVSAVTLDTYHYTAYYVYVFKVCVGRQQHYNHHLSTSIVPSRSFTLTVVNNRIVLYITHTPMIVIIYIIHIRRLYVYTITRVWGKCASGREEFYKTKEDNINRM